MDKRKMAMSVEDLARQNCASILRAREERRIAALAQASRSANNRLSMSLKRVYKCKMCDLAFETSQALGGHVTHHAKTTPEGDGREAVPPQDTEIHECKDCHVRFSNGSALRGHQTKHTKASRKQRRGRGGGRKPQTESSRKPVLPFDLNLPPVD